MYPDAHQQAKPDKQRHHRCATVGNQRQRYADHRNKPHDHGDINEDIKKELISKLEEFATPSENLEEIFENKEQIEVSKFYERLPKAHAIAIDNWLLEKIYYRKPENK